ncbi:MAG: hypothetical protein H7319_07285 [Spirosoma sp.]|nr:hypothetical protein [Spirosoma sp.]
MTNATDRTELYFQQVKFAKDDAERQQIAAEYRAYYAQLADNDKVVADKVRKAHFDNLKQELDEFEPTLQRAMEMLERMY